MYSVNRSLAVSPSDLRANWAVTTTRRRSNRVNARGGRLAERVSARANKDGRAADLLYEPRIREEGAARFRSAGCGWRSLRWGLSFQALGLVRPHSRPSNELVISRGADILLEDRIRPAPASPTTLSVTLETSRPGWRRRQYALGGGISPVDAAANVNVASVI